MIFFSIYEAKRTSKNPNFGCAESNVAGNAASVADVAPIRAVQRSISINVFAAVGVDVVVFYLVLSAANTEQSTL